MSERESLYSLELDELKEKLSSWGFSPYTAQQIYGWPYKQFNYDPQTWSNLSQKFREELPQLLDTSLPKIVWDQLSVDGTRKFLVQLNDGETVECVVIPSKGRLTLCVSSQVGCAIGCKFCHTGTMGFRRNLSAGEIVGEFLVAQRFLKNIDESLALTNMVFMGQGEPLNNFEAVKKAISIFLDNRGIGMGQRRITVSTSGLAPQIEKLWDFPPVNIAISLHAAHNHIRTELMPINRVYDLERLFQAIKTIPLKPHRHITYEYLLIDGMNDRIEDVRALADLINQHESKINLIVFNEYPGSPFKRPTDQKVRWFQSEL